MLLDHLSCKIVLSLNSFFHFVSLGKNKKHVIQYLVFLHSNIKRFWNLHLKWYLDLLYISM